MAHYATMYRKPLSMQYKFGLEQGTIKVKYNTTDDNVMTADGVVVGSVKYTSLRGWTAITNGTFTEENALHLYTLIGFLKDNYKNGKLPT